MASWAEARHRARALESKIDSKLVAYLNLANKINSDSSAPSDIEAYGSKHPLRELESDISGMLEELGSVTDEMDKLVKSSSNREGYETMRRCQNLFHQFSADFERTKEKIEKKSKRAQLLGSKHDGKNSSLAGIRPHEALEKERDSLFSSLGIVDSLIERGQTAMDELKSQRGIFGRVRGTLGALGQQFPQANNLIKMIQDKQNRDTVILAFVIASCMFFTFMYSYYSR